MNLGRKLKPELDNLIKEDKYGQVLNYKTQHAWLAGKNTRELCITDVKS